MGIGQWLGLIKLERPCAFMPLEKAGIAAQFDAAMQAQETIGLAWRLSGIEECGDERLALGAGEALGGRMHKDSAYRWWVGHTAQSKAGDLAFVRVATQCGPEGDKERYAVGGTLYRAVVGNYFGL